MVRIEDERGRSWVAFEGDPAYEMVQKLEKKGYRYIVLPTEYFTGVRQEPMYEHEQHTWYLAGIGELETGGQVEDDTLAAEYTKVGIRYLQLSECIANAAA